MRSDAPIEPTDGTILVVPGHCDPEFLRGYLGPYRLLLSDLVVLTMGGGPDVGPEDLTRLTSHVHRLKPDARIVVTDFRPVPLGDVRGRKVYFATTAPQAVGSALASHLEEAFGCAVVGRELLRREDDREPGLVAWRPVLPEYVRLRTSPVHPVGSVEA
jgi:cyclic 2,3-diphosphoglycerate synthase